MQQLSAQDASFVYLETPHTPMHIGSVSTFEAGPLCHANGELRLDDIRAKVLARLPLVPRMATRLRAVPFGRPVWVDDDDFDVPSFLR